jgi:hypothetical protein
MALFHKQNSAGEKPLVRRVAQRGGGGLFKTRLRGRGFKSRRNNFKFYPLLTRLPGTQTAKPALAVGFIATNYRHHHHMGKGLITLQYCTVY